MTFEESRDLLLAHLRHRWGDEPTWTFRLNHEYGYYLLYRFALVSTGDVRALIENLFGFAGPCSFILGDLGEPGASVAGENLDGQTPGS